MNVFSLKSARDKKEVALPGLILVVLLVGVFAVSVRMFSDHSRSHQIEVEVTAEQASRRIESFIKARTMPLIFAGDAIRDHGSELEFRKIAAKILGQFQDYQAVNWIDPSWIIRITVPEAGNENALGKDLHNRSDRSVQEAIARAEETKTITASGAIPLLQGGLGIATYIPVLDDGGRILGFVNGIFRIERLIEASFPEADFRRQFNLSLTDWRKIGDYSSSDGTPAGKLADPVTVSLKVVDRQWFLTVAPSARFGGRVETRWAYVLIIMGVVLSILVALSFRAVLVRQRDLYKSEERFRSITDDVLDNLHAGIIITDAQRRVVWINRSIKRYLNITRKEMVGRDQRDLIRTRIKDVFADPDTFERKLLAAYEDNTYIERFECHILPQEGRRERWLEHRSQPINSGLYAGGRIEHYYGITMRKRAEDAMAEGREKLRAIFDNAADGILLADIETGSYIESNNEICRMLGYSHVELLSLSVGDIHPPEDREWVRKVFQRQAAREIKMARDIPIVRKDESVFFADVSSGFVTLDGKGYLIRLFRDVTERKKAEEDLRRSERNWEGIFQSIGHPAIVLNAGMEVMEANNAALAATGLALEEIIGRKCFEVFHKPGSEDPPPGCPFSDILQSGSTGVRDVAMDMLDGWHLVSCTPIFGEDGHLEKGIHIATNITEHRRLEGELRQSTKMEAVGILAGGVAHDFNNILQAIYGYTELALREAEPGSDLVKYLEGIGAVSERGSSLTKQMLAFSRKQVLKLEVLDINEEIRNLVDFLRRVIGEDVDMQVQLESEPVLVKADSVQVQQIMMNLVVNAREAMPSGGTVFIEISRSAFGDDIIDLEPEALPGTYAMISVIDTGIGIEADVLGHIFEPFYTTKGRDKGSGLGLSTVFGIVKQHGGFMQVSSAVADGTAFRIYFPIADGAVVPGKAHIEPGEARPGPGPGQGQGQVLLVVEDEEVVRELVGNMLHTLGYKVLSAATPGEAVDLVSAYEGPIHLLITDVILPEMNGVELSGVIMRTRPDIKTLFMSGYSDTPTNLQGDDREDRFFLQKPFTMQDLASTINLILE